ncbi:flagellar biosynthesis anti-sigma factor FlgM [Paenibacillus durus]|uniref:Flagellar synthesis anti-sigma-D factor n=2 Tax=Paenibacillus durus TaxID=44251 RepID=A0A089HVN5_PAEDU|nr:flagellar biosynthesis anti-sigma factor FlgM [Paenibacillus durus]AIQ14820.1 flagellar synthesis anti-sigma-D factor [Paenibacillus durus]AKG36573.1 flagellar synthesis anti-sigma-D factor [Paenibacillus durus ATCC 35681]
MKINDTGRINGINSYQKAVESGTIDNVRKARKKDEVSISTEALEMLRAQQTSNAERAQKIEDLKNRVSSGTYHVEARDLAEKLLPYFKKSSQD